MTIKRSVPGPITTVYWISLRPHGDKPVYTMVTESLAEHERMLPRVGSTVKLGHTVFDVLDVRVRTVDDITGEFV